MRDESVWKEYYRCNECGEKWQHEWDNDDYNNDFTQCPEGCDDFDFDDITIDEFRRKDTNELATDTDSTKR